MFGAWSGWTYDYDEWVVNHADPNVNYCEYSPMMTAFFILIIKWVRQMALRVCVGRLLFLIAVDYSYYDYTLVLLWLSHHLLYLLHGGNWSQSCQRCDRGCQGGAGGNRIQSLNLW